MNCPIVRATSAVHLGQPASSLVRKAFLLLIFIVVIIGVSRGHQGADQAHPSENALRDE